MRMPDLDGVVPAHVQNLLPIPEQLAGGPLCIAATKMLSQAITHHTLIHHAKSNIELFALLVTLAVLQSGAAT